MVGGAIVENGIEECSTGIPTPPTGRRRAGTRPWLQYGCNFT